MNQKQPNITNTTITQLICKDVWNTENRFGFDLEKPTVQKFDIRSDGFPTATVCNLQFELKVTKYNFTCTQERFKH